MCEREGETGHGGCRLSGAKRGRKRERARGADSKGGEREEIVDAVQWRVAICSRWLPYRVLWLPLYSPLACKLTLFSVSLSSLSRRVSLALSPSYSRTYQRQGKLIYPPVRRTLTGLNVWFPFMFARTYARTPTYLARTHRAIRVGLPIIVPLIDPTLQSKPQPVSSNNQPEGVKCEKCATAGNGVRMGRRSPR